ncbi:MAG: NERD domain-containing protein [Kiritimatiellae bacterium]|nr:NERD domain-containing protein [Kiritimatiellia bacterium]
MTSAEQSGERRPAAIGGAARTIGSPGERARMLGLVSIYWPLPLAILLCGWFLRAAFPHPALSPRIAGLSLAALCGACWAASDKFARRFGHFLKGARGEELAARELAALPEGWTVVHGVARMGRASLRGGGDVDHVLVGPSGVFAVETKNWAGPVRIDEGRVFAGGAPVTRSPVVQTRREARELGLALAGTLPAGVPVRGIVCFAGDEPDPPYSAVDGTEACALRLLRQTVLAHPAAPGFGEEERERAVQALLRRR